MTDEVVDVVVVGSGGAGLAAALAAAQAGAQQVMVVESEGVIGGSSRLASGIVMGSGSELQKNAGLVDSPQAFLHDYLAWTNLAVSIGPVATLTSRSGETIDWLAELGVPFDPELVRCNFEVANRGHAVHGGGQAIVDVMTSACRKAGVEFALGQRVERVVVEDSAAVGVQIGGEVLRARAVVIATGGFGANPEKIAEFFPGVHHPTRNWYIGADGARGDAIDFAREIDLQLTGYNYGLRTLTPDFSPEHMLESHLPGWSVLIDSSGRRFLDESYPYGALDARFRAVGDRAFIIFDDTALRPPADQVNDYRNAYRAKWPTRDAFRPVNWVADKIDDMVDKGRVTKADSVSELAVHLGLPPDALASELARYNRFVDAGYDLDHHKQARFLKPVKPPLYGVELRPFNIAETAYGLRITERAEVIHENGYEVAGLYAAGECTGGVLGPTYVGSGNSLMNSYVMGRVAGESAASYLAARA